MEGKLEQYWEKAKEAIVNLWRDEVDEKDLEKPMDAEQLCEYFGEKCRLSRQQSEERVERVMREIDFRPPGV